MKRFLLFSGDHYYPAGGWSDFDGDFDTLEEAEYVARKIMTASPQKPYPPQWYHITDTVDGKVVAMGVQ